ncbi:MAG: DUF1501 domain-containing protein [Planctomycetaceae bacterium]
MFNVGRLLPAQRGGLSRRALLQAGSLGALGVSLADLFRAEAAARATGRRPRSIILLWLWGGPSHIDTFDPKPKAQLEYRGPYAPVKTAVPGTQICELFPQLAKRANRYTILRALHHTSNDHGISGTIGLTGSDKGAVSLGGKTLRGTLQPTHGSVVSRVLGFDPSVPRFLTVGGHLHQGHKPIVGEGGGALGAMHDPFRLDFDPRTGLKVPQLTLGEWQSSHRLNDRRKLLRALDGTLKQAESAGGIHRLDEFYQQAFSLLTSAKTRGMFDLNREPDKLRTRYGRFRFGQCCLLARRLIQAGARFVQVNWSSHVEPVEDTGDGGWDMHDRNFQQLQDRHAWMLDQSLSALLDDLQTRGMLDDTIVVAVGEFGRTPKINGKAGRDHWNKCYSGLVAGGGLRAGRVIGSSDKRGEHPVDAPITPTDLFRTVLQQVGIGTTDLTGVGLTPRGELIEQLM